jgi:sphingosine kinase
MFNEASIIVRLLTTERPRHAFEFCAKVDLSSIDTIITVGGDGILFEVINGLYSREDVRSSRAPIPVFPIPGGTGNGLAKSILYDINEDFSPTTAAFVAIKGKPRRLDLSYVQTKTQSHYAFLILGWGLISDVDILSETMRWMGEPRMYVAAVYFTALRRMYRGRLTMYTGTDNEIKGNEMLRTPENEAKSALPPLDVHIQSGNGWTVLDSEFLLVWVLQTSHCSGSVHSGPGVTLDDGLFTIIVARDLSRFEIVKLLLDLDNGDHVRHPKIEIFKALSYRLEPANTDVGLYSLDGEVVEYGPIQASVLPSAAQTLSL